MALYHRANHRRAEQLEEMERLEQAGVCLFCPEQWPNLKQGLLHETDHWLLVPNRYPYVGARLHLLLVPRRHVRDVLALESDALADFWEALRWTARTYSLEFYGLGIRCGDCRYTGGTIEHLHAHIIVGDTADPDHRPIRFKVSSRPSPAAT